MYRSLRFVIKTFLVKNMSSLSVSLILIIGLNSCVNGKKIWSDEEKFLDYGSTTKFVPMHLRKKSGGSQTTNSSQSSSTSLSPQQALELAKTLVLPLNDTARERAMKAYGTNKQGMEKMMEQWMKDNANSSFLRPMKVALRIDDDFGVSKLLAPNMKHLNFVASNFWNSSDIQSLLQPFLRNQTTKVGASDFNKILRDKGKSARLDLPAARFWDVDNAAAQPNLPYATTMKHVTREKKNLPEDPDDWTQPPTTQSRHQAAVHQIIEEPNIELKMYDYRSPSFDEMPTHYLLKTTTQTTFSIPDISPTLYPEPNNTHRAVARARELMWNHNLKHLSAFISTFCEILSIHKTRRDALRLAIGLMVNVESLIRSGRLAHLGTETMRKLEECNGLLSEFRDDNLEALLNMIHQVFLDHSYFANDTQEVIREIENWYSMHEGEALFETLIAVEEFPHQGKNQKVVMEEVLDAALKPYYRLGAGSSKRSNLLLKLELVMTRVHRRQFKPNFNENLQKRSKYTAMTTKDIKMKEYFGNLRLKEEERKRNMDSTTISDKISREKEETNEKSFEVDRKPISVKRTTKSSDEIKLAEFVEKHKQDKNEITDININRAKNDKDVDEELERAKKIVEMDRDNYNIMGRPIKKIARTDIDKKYKFDTEDGTKGFLQRFKSDSDVETTTLSNLIFDIKNNLYKITTEKQHSTSRTTKLYKRKKINSSRNITKDEKAKKKNMQNEKKVEKNNTDEIRKLIREGIEGIREKNEKQSIKLRKIVAKYAHEMKKGNRNISDRSSNKVKDMSKVKALEKKINKDNRKYRNTDSTESQVKSSFETRQFGDDDVLKNIIRGVTKFKYQTKTEKATERTKNPKSKARRNKNRDYDNRKKHKSYVDKDKNKESIPKGTQLSRITRVYYPKRYTVKGRPNNDDWEDKYMLKSREVKKITPKRVKPKLNVKSKYVTTPLEEVKSKYAFHSKTDDEEIEKLKYVSLTKVKSDFMKGLKPKENIKRDYNSTSSCEHETKYVSYEKDFNMTSIGNVIETNNTNIDEHNNDNNAYNSSQERYKNEERRHFEPKHKPKLDNEEVPNDNVPNENKKSKYVNVLLDSKENTQHERKIRDRFQENFAMQTKIKPSAHSMNKIKPVTEVTNKLVNKTTAKNYALGHLIEFSSYSDEETNIKTNLDDALRHDGIKNVTNVGRRANLVRKEKPLLDVTSISDEEGVLKNNIYKVFGSGLNKYHDD